MVKTPDVLTVAFNTFRDHLKLCDSIIQHALGVQRSFFYSDFSFANALQGFTKGITT